MGSRYNCTQKIIEDLDADEYSLQDWSDSIDYLVGEKVSPACPAEAKRYLLLKLLPLVFLTIFMDHHITLDLSFFKIYTVHVFF